MSDLEFTPEEWEVHFGDHLSTRPSDEPRRPARWRRAIGVVVAVAMLGGSVAFLVDQVRNRAELQEPVEVRDHAAARVAESPLGFLATDIVVLPIANPDVGGRVENSPPDGIVQIDRRPWNRDRLDRLVDHELGHLLDFAVWAGDPDAFGGRRGGLESEPWAECAAVDAGTRSVDSSIDDPRYHCTADELAVYRATVDAIVAAGEVCRAWGSTADRCRAITR